MRELLCASHGPRGPVAVSTQRQARGSGARPLRPRVGTAICGAQLPIIPVERCGRPMAQQYIYQMQGLTKAFPGAPKKTFSDIWLSFYPDAKIGVVAATVSRKSPLLPLMPHLPTHF